MASLRGIPANTHMLCANMQGAALLLYILLLSVTTGIYSSSCPTRISRPRPSPSQHVVGKPSQNARGRKRSNSSLGQSSNWAGVGLSANPGTYKSATGTFTVTTPVISAAGGNQSQDAAVWVGIDGITCSSAMLQTGLDLHVDVEGNVSYDAWYEWFPDGAKDFTGITFKSGDVVMLSVTATSTTDASAMIENKSSGQTVSKTLSSSSELCMQDAEWIIADFLDGDVMVPFANFGTITFTNASANTSKGKVGPDSGAQIFVMETGGNETLTRTLVDGSSVEIQYAMSDDPSTSTSATGFSISSSSTLSPSSSTLSRSSPSATIPRTSRTSSVSSASPSPSSSSSSSFSHSAVIGGVLGGVLGGLLIGLCLFLFLRRREHRHRKQEARPTLLVPAPPITDTVHGPKLRVIGNGLLMSSHPETAMAQAAPYGEEDRDRGGSAPLAPLQMNERQCPGDRHSWITDGTQDSRGRPPMYFPPPPEYRSQ